MLVGTSDAARYWELPGKTLEQVFGRDPHDAYGLEQEVRGTRQSEQELFYHNEPLTIAAEVAGAKPTRQQIDQYKRLRSQMYGVP